MKSGGKNSGFLRKWWDNPVVFTKSDSTMWWLL
jgi:hypothetical protein